jgi:hypothetical protein
MLLVTKAEAVKEYEAKQAKLAKKQAKAHDQIQGEKVPTRAGESEPRRPGGSRSRVPPSGAMLTFLTSSSKWLTLHQLPIHIEIIVVARAFTGVPD